METGLYALHSSCLFSWSISECRFYRNGAEFLFLNNNNFVTQIINYNAYYNSELL